MRQRALVVLCVLVSSLPATAGSAQQGTAAGGTQPSGLTSPTRANMRTGTAAVSGMVIDAVTRQPVPGAVVLIADRAFSPTPELRMFTDSKGRFVFSRLPASTRYQITTAKLGYFDGGYGQAVDQEAPASLVLADGQWLRDIIVEMWRPGAITGTVVDEQGEPLVDVYVRAFQEIRFSGRAHYAIGPTVKTDDRGAYRLANMRPGRYVVFVPSVQMSVPTATPGATLAGTSPARAAALESMGREVPAYTDPGLNVDAANRLALGYYLPPPVPASGRVMSYPPTFYPNASSVSRANVVELFAGTDLRGIDLRVDPLPASRVSGIVQAPSGSPPKFTLRLLAAGNEGLGRGAETATALVGEDGRFVFLNVPAGEYVIDASGSMAQLTARASSTHSLPRPPGLHQGSGASMSLSIGPAGTGVQTDDSPVGARHWGRLNVSVSGRDVTNLVVALRPTVSLSGRFVYEGKSQLPGTPAFGLMLEPVGGDVTLGVPANRLLGSGTNEFRFEGLQPAGYLLRSSSSNSNPWEVKSVTAGGRDYTHTPFDATTGIDIDNVLVTFTDTTPTIAGSVRDASGTVLSRAAVIAFPVEKAQWMNYGLRPTRLKSTSLTSAKTFQLTRLPAGDYFVIAVDERQESRWQDPAFLEAASRVATRVSLAWEDTKTLDLTLAVVR